MKYISLFSGIGGFDLAFERAGMECIAVCEIDRNAQGILKRHFPKAQLFDDVRNIGAATHERGSIDLICGGFPCQDLSVAGKRAGLAGERSGLWFEFARVIDELEPRWVVIENVPGLLSSNKGGDFAVIIRWLAERGYGVAWRILDAQYFGVPQRRRRVFIVGSLGNGSAAEVLFEREGLSGDTPPRGEAGKEVAYSLRSHPSHSGDKGDGGINTTLVAAHETGQGFWQEGDISGTLRAEGENRPSRPSNIIVDIVEQNNVVSTPDMISLRSNPAQPVIFQQNTRDEVRLIGGDGQRARALAAQAGMKQQNYVAFGGNNTSGPIEQATALNAKGRTGRSDFESETFITMVNVANSGANQNNAKQSKIMDTLDTWNTVAVQRPSGVRRLTPTECERLQGFPDGWTDGQSDSARYRQLGNAVAVPVVEWIGRRIKHYDDQSPHLT